MMRQKLKTNFLEHSLPMPHCPGIPSPLFASCKWSKGNWGEGWVSQHTLPSWHGGGGAEETERGTKRLFRNLIQADMGL